MAYCILKSYKLRLSPFEIFRAFKDRKNCFFLDSSLNADYSLGRYSFLGIEPFHTLEVNKSGPFDKLRGLLDRYRLSLPQGNPPFLGGAVGYLSYDLGFILEEKLKPQPKPDTQIPGCLFAFYNSAVIIDHLKNALYIFSCGFPETRYAAARLLAERNFKKIFRLLDEAAGIKDRDKLKDGPRHNSIGSNFTKEDYLAAVKRAKEYIKAGDIYQVNLSQQFRAKSDLCAFGIYQRLRRLSPSYFGAYFDAGDFQILSSSPERFLKVEGDTVITRPMKGTRPCPPNTAMKKKFRGQLLQSAKDKAELTMIVDLERNDLGRVCSYDSVRVLRLRELEEYSTVFQTTATVCGRLHKNRDSIDLLRACFPGGSITGCPKIRAMEIIEELEPGRRGIYTGCLGYFSFSGPMEFNILIRSILKRNNELCFGAGGGIVADSVAEEEYNETLVKAAAMAKAIGARDTLSFGCKDGPALAGRVSP
ncbi:MAG: anthranilate synthase component I family protein [Candidatus Omnitrophica bacterium]|nr:anthranilate synthase component I family protein [Candidatus Omnitrophota bacterium]MBL7210387.1 anthranilate synthase component I family protein [Candidatus Omnitrophota bacterium]